MDKGPRPPGWSNADAACFNAEAGCYTAGTFVFGFIASAIAGLIFAMLSGETAGYTAFVLGMLITIAITWLNWHTSHKVR